MSSYITKQGRTSHPVTHSIMYVRQRPGKLADESCPLCLPHDTNMTFVSWNVYN